MDPAKDTNQVNTNQLQAEPSAPSFSPNEVIYSSETTFTNQNVSPKKTSFFKNKLHLSRKLVFLVIPLIFLLVMVLLPNVLTSLTRNTQQSEVVPTSEPKLIVEGTPEPIVRTDPFEGWKTYKNIESLISFKIPPDHSLNEERLPGSVTKFSFLQNVSAQEGENLTSGSFSESDMVLTVSKGSSPVLQLRSLAPSMKISEKEEEITISGTIGLKGDKYVYIEREGRLYFFVNKSIDASLFEKFLSTVAFQSQGVTEDWSEFRSDYGFTFRYPPLWGLRAESGDKKSSESASLLTVFKDPQETEFQNLVIDIQKIGGRQSIELTASEAISSLSNLSGWRTTPFVEVRNIGLGQSQIISGERNGGWEDFAVIWYRDTLIQFAWRDTALKQEEDNFLNILSSFRFTN